MLTIQYHNTISFDKKIPTIIEENVTGDGDGDGAGDDGAVTNINTNIKATGEILEDITGAGGDIGVVSKFEETVIIDEKLIEPPPPLPISRPPSQVVAFALNAPEIAVNKVVENWEKIDTVQAPKISMVDLESEFLEQTEVVLSPDNKKLLENIVDENTVEEQVKTEEKNEVLSGIEIEITKVEEDIDDPNVLAMTAAASLMIDQVTATAVEIVTDMSKALQNENHNELIATEDSEDVNANDEELPPPPPSPPSVQECFEDCEDTGAVEYVLNQFESKMNEIEQKVMNCDTISLPEHVELSSQVHLESNIVEDDKTNNLYDDIEENLNKCVETAETEEQYQFELCETEMGVAPPPSIETLLEHNIQIEDEATAKNIEETVETHAEEENKAESETKSENNDSLEDIVKENDYETQEASVKVENKIENVTAEIEKNGHETEEPVPIKEIMETEKESTEIEQHDNESDKELNKNLLYGTKMQDNNNKEDEKFDATAMIMEQIDKMTLNDEINFETTIDDNKDINNKKSTAADDEKFMKDDDGGDTNKPQLIDFENVKVNTTKTTTRTLINVFSLSTTSTTTILLATFTSNHYYYYYYYYYYFLNFLLLYNMLYIYLYPSSRHFLCLT